MRSLSKIIKAAELKVLVPDDSTEIIRPVIDLETGGAGETLQAAAHEGTILEASGLIAQAKAKAADIIRMAEEEAEALRTRLRQEAEELSRQAESQGYEDGFKAGLAEGKQSADEEAARLLGLLRQLVDQAAADRARALAKLEEDFLKLSLILAEKIVRKAINDDPAWLKPLIEEVCQKLGTVTECVVRLSPEDYRFLKTEELRLAAGGLDRVSFRPDPSLGPGGCIIETDGGTVDASLEKRLGKLAQHLMEVMYSG